MNVTIVYHCGMMDELKSFYRELDNKGIHVTAIVPKRVVINPTDSNSQSLVATPEDSNPSYRMIPVDLISAHNYKWGFWPFQLGRALKTSCPDIIHVFNEYYSFPVTETIFLRNIFLNTKIPVLIYAFQNIDYRQLKNEIIPDFFRKTVRKIFSCYNLKYTYGATGASQDALNILKGYKQTLKLKEIFWGVDTKRFYPKDQKTCREKLKLPVDKKLIGYFGRMVPEKGLKCLLEATAKLNDACLLLVGNGPYLDKMKNIAKDLSIEGRVIIKPPVDHPELNDYYNSLDCFILASESTATWKEQYGRVLVEAMACHIPIVGSSSGVIPSMLSGYPRHVIFQEKNTAALAESIKHLLDKQLENFSFDKLGQFDIKQFALQHSEFYKEVLRVF